MKGFGTVITGTLISGSISVGDTIMVYPSRITSKVRGIQVHNQSANTAKAGMRTAINFQGLDKSAVKRGEVLSIPGALVSSYMVDVSFHFLARCIISRINLRGATYILKHFLFNKKHK